MGDTDTGNASQRRDPETVRRIDPQAVIRILQARIGELELEVAVHKVALEASVREEE